MSANLRISLFTFAALVLALLAFYEVAIAYPVAWWLYLAVAIAFVLALWPFAPGRFQRSRIFSLLTISAVIAALYFVPWTSRKPFLRDLDRVHVGMTEAEARHIMSRYMEGTGWPASPFGSPTNSSTLSIVGSSSQYSTTTSPDGHMVIRDSLVFRHSTDGAYNSDWGIVSLSSGRVVSVEFSPD
jgi:hypothetical protein